MNESEFNRRWSRALEVAGAQVLAVVGSAMQEPGWPDRYVAALKWTGWLEGKRADGALSAVQRVRVLNLLCRGVPVFVVRLKRTDAKVLTPRDCVIESPVPMVGSDSLGIGSWISTPLPLIRRGMHPEVDGGRMLAVLAELTPPLVDRWLIERSRVRKLMSAVKAEQNGRESDELKPALARGVEVRRGQKRRSELEGAAFVKPDIVVLGGVPDATRGELRRAEERARRALDREKASR